MNKLKRNLEAIPLYAMDYNELSILCKEQKTEVERLCDSFQCVKEIIENKHTFPKELNVWDMINDICKQALKEKE